MANQTTTTHGTQPPAAPTRPGDTPTPEPLLGPEQSGPTPLDPPVMYANIKWRVPGIMVNTQEQADAIDPSEWVKTTATADTGPSARSLGAPKPQYPQLYGNVNVPPKLVGDANQAKALGDDWKKIDLPEPLVKSAQAELDAQAAQAQADAQKQSASGQHGSDAQRHPASGHRGA